MCEINFHDIFACLSCVTWSVSHYDKSISPAKVITKYNLSISTMKQPQLENTSYDNIRYGKHILSKQSDILSKSFKQETFSCLQSEKCSKLVDIILEVTLKIS